MDKAKATKLFHRSAMVVFQLEEHEGRQSVRCQMVATSSAPPEVVEIAREMRDMFHVHWSATGGILIDKESPNG